MRHRTMLLALAVLTLGRGALGQELKEFATFRGTTRRICSAALSPDGKKMASGAWDLPTGEVTLWDVPTGKEINTFTLDHMHPQTMRFSPNGKLLAANIFLGAMVWDVATHKQLASFKTNVGSSGILAFSPDGKKLGLGGPGEVQIWDVTTGKKLSSFRCPPFPRANRPVAFRADLRTLALGNAQEIDLWDVASGKRRTILSEHRGRVNHVAYSSDGKTLVAASCLDRGRWNYVGDVRLWDVATGRTRAIFQEGIAVASSACLSPDGKTLALLNRRFVLDREMDVIILDVATGKQRVLHFTRGNSFTILTFATDGRLFLIDNPDYKTIKLWEVLLGKKVAPPGFTPGDAGAH